MFQLTCEPAENSSKEKQSGSNANPVEKEGPPTLLNEMVLIRDECKDVDQGDSSPPDLSSPEPPLEPLANEEANGDESTSLVESVVPPGDAEEGDNDWAVSSEGIYFSHFMWSYLLG